jgi:hypothetical protein
VGSSSGSSNSGGPGGNPQPVFLWKTNKDNISELLRQAPQDLIELGLVEKCHYASRRYMRPKCEGLASVRYGSVALCASCDEQRSLVGDGTTGVNLAAPGALLEVVRAAKALLWALEAANAAGHRPETVGAALKRSIEIGRSLVTAPAAEQRRRRAGRPASRIVSKAGPRAGSLTVSTPGETGCLYNEVPPPARAFEDRTDFIEALKAQRGLVDRSFPTIGPGRTRR